MRNPDRHEDRLQDLEDSHFDDHWPARPQAMATRRNSMQVPMPHDAPVRYQPQRTLSYPVAVAEAPIDASSYAYAAHQVQPTTRYITEAAHDAPPPDMVQVQDVVEMTLEALQQKNMNAVEHMQRAQAQAQAQRRPLLRRNTVSSRGPSRDVDEWANHDMHMPAAGYDRVGAMHAGGMQVPRALHRAPVPVTGGGFRYVDV